MKRAPEDMDTDSSESRKMPRSNFELDCYPYTFSPLLLFSGSDYFDKGHSNYNAVAQFFHHGLVEECGVDMLHNVLYERKNMLYEELIDHIIAEAMIVTCCIDNHFTAFQVLSGREPALLYYDPMKPTLTLVYGRDSFVKFAGYLLLKCGYADSQHIQDNKSHYTGEGTNQTRREIYRLWQKINQVELGSLLYSVRTKTVTLNLDQYLLVNSDRNPTHMSTQATGNTCYFQTYLFAMLCRICQPDVGSSGGGVELENVALLEKATLYISRFLLTFFCEPGGVLRPLTNSNVVIDFFRYNDSAYYRIINKYLSHRVGRSDLDYNNQYREVMYYLRSTKILHKYGKFSVGDPMPATINTKSLQPVYGTDDCRYKLCSYNYYKYRAANLMFGFNTNIMRRLTCFAEFNALRKNQLLAFYDEISPFIGHASSDRNSTGCPTKYRDYYFMPQYEIGQQELVDLHYHTYELDLHALTGSPGNQALVQRLNAVNHFLVHHIHFSTQRLASYDKMMSLDEFKMNKDYYQFFADKFMSAQFLKQFAGLGFPDMNPREKEINSLTQTVFYNVDMMKRQAYRQEYEFEKECINQMARSTLNKYTSTLEGKITPDQGYRVELRIGHGVTYSRYNTLMHFLSAVDSYWSNPDLNSVQMLGKDIRTVLSLCCQKVFFHTGHSYYHYGPVEMSYSTDIQVGNPHGEGVWPFVSRMKQGKHGIVITDRVYEYQYLRSIIDALFDRRGGNRIKTDDPVINLTLLSLLLDFGLYEEYASALNIPMLSSVKAGDPDTRKLQVEVSNVIHDCDKANKESSISRLHVEELIFEASNKFMMNKNFSLRSREFEIMNRLSADPASHRYLLLCKVYMSLCQINRSVEVDYYRVRVDGEYEIIIPHKFSKGTGEYLEQVTRQYNFTERDGWILHDGMPLFHVRTQPGQQPDIDLHKVRFDSGPISSMVKYVEVSNVFRVSDLKYLIFIADNTMLVEYKGADVSITLNRIPVEISTVYFNEALSFVPCFKYEDSEDVIMFTSRNIHYLVDSGGQFNDNYYGMRHELIECIESEQAYTDLNDHHVFKVYKLSELLSESKTVFYFPDYLLQVTNRQQLINLLDLSIYIRNISFFILVLIYLVRASIALSYIQRDKNKVTKITGPWRDAILYVLNKSSNDHYDKIFSGHFIDLNQFRDLPLEDFVEELCAGFTRYQRFVDGAYQIVPTEKQKQFLMRIMRSEACFHFSEVGSGKTKVILPLLCQAFLSNNREVHKCLSRGGKKKSCLVVLVPEHLVNDALTQVFRYCLNINFREDYRIYDDIFALLHQNVEVSNSQKKIFVTSFNQVKKALTYDEICRKVEQYRENFLFIVDEVDDFLDRDKLVFNICSNKENNFDDEVLENYFRVSEAVYKRESFPEPEVPPRNPDYWEALYAKYNAIHEEVQEKSRSINKSFGIFNEQTLRHCSTNIAHDIEGYKALIARPYESVNRAMPGSYYSDVERTMYLTYYVLMEDTSKYDELFQQERKFISYEYYNQFIQHVDYDELVYGLLNLSALVEQHPETKPGITRFLYKIILRRMEIRDHARSVNSIDVVFNFDCIGFTGTPFIDNYPTAAYINRNREDEIPDMIDRSFYVYSKTNEEMTQSDFEERFAQFQAANYNVMIEYVPSDFMQGSLDELDVLEQVLSREGQQDMGCNVVVDLCGVFKKTNIYQVANLVVRHYGKDRFKYIYHIGQSDGSDRVLALASGNDVTYDEEFYKYLCKNYDKELREKIFFFIDNRNVIGKDVPFQLIYQKHYGLPLFSKSAVLAHDVDDFSKIWQAMGRSRTMNDTQFAIYLKSSVSEEGLVTAQGGRHDIKVHPLSRQLYVRNCDRKSAGNFSSIYQTLISLLNLTQERFYHTNDIVNVFLDKLELTIESKVRRHQETIVRNIMSSALARGILCHIFIEKFSKSASLDDVTESLDMPMIQSLTRQIVQQMYEQRIPTGDVYDDLIRFLSGDQLGQMEITYTKQHQKQKTKQHNKNQDSDTMEVFTRENQMLITEETDDYFKYTLGKDLVKTLLNVPIPEPILKFSYSAGGRVHVVNIFPTLQFLYSLYAQGPYITKRVKEYVSAFNGWESYLSLFDDAVSSIESADADLVDDSETSGLSVKLISRHIRQNPQYTLAGIRRGVYVIGMKDQLNDLNLSDHPLLARTQYIADESGFILYDNGRGERSLDSFGPYCVEQYVLMELLSKTEVAENVLNYYVNYKSKLEDRLDQYTESHGKGFVCWRFIMSGAPQSK